MNMEERQEGEVLVLKPLFKRLDAYTSASFKGWVVDRIIGGAKRIVLNLERVDFIDSTGLGALISLLKTIGDRDDFVLCGVRMPVTSLFRVTRMDRVFGIHESEEEALRAISERAKEAQITDRHSHG